MYIVNSYSMAVFLCIITMLCWGSWGNTQKLTSKNWRFELFYWDYVIGILLFSLLLGFTLGSNGEQGRPFIENLSQADLKSYVSCFIGGLIFNASNILLTASMVMAGMAIAFPIGVGLALVLGVFVNYYLAPKGDPVILFTGVALVGLAILYNSIAAAKMNKNSQHNTRKNKGIVLALLAGILMSFFYRFVASSMDLENFINPNQGLFTPYSAFFVFSVGIFISNLCFNTYMMKKPFDGVSVCYKEYFSGDIKSHFMGILGGCIWALGTSLSYISAGKAGAAISYALGQGAPMIAALWGILVWKEFKGAKRNVILLLLLMFMFYLAGLYCIILSGNN